LVAEEAAAVTGNSPSETVLAHLEEVALVELLEVLVLHQQQVMQL
jgi:hypothetical protein